VRLVRSLIEAWYERRRPPNAHLLRNTFSAEDLGGATHAHITLLFIVIRESLLVVRIGYLAEEGAFSSWVNVLGRFLLATCHILCIRGRSQIQHLI